MIEPWISGSHADVNALLRPLFHSFEHAKLDLAKWTEGLTTEQVWARPMDLGPVGFHIRHIAGSSDRLFTYVLGQQLSEAQMAAMKAEMEPGASLDDLLTGMSQTLDRIAAAAQTLDPATLSEFRGVGRKQLPTTVMGLLVHIAEHTQRHVGEAIITAKVVRKLADSTTT